MSTLNLSPRRPGSHGALRTLQATMCVCDTLHQAAYPGLAAKSPPSGASKPGINSSILFRLQDLAQTLPQRSKEINVLSDILWATRCSRIKRMCYHVSTTKEPFDTIPACFTSRVMRPIASGALSQTPDNRASSLPHLRQNALLGRSFRKPAGKHHLDRSRQTTS